MSNGDWSFHVNNQLTRNDHPQYQRVATSPTSLVQSLTAGTNMAVTGGDGSGHGALTMGTIAAPTFSGTVTAGGYVDSTDVLVGGLVAQSTGPGIDTSYSAATTVFTLAAPLVAGHTYQLTLAITSAQQITNASAGSFVYCSDSAGLIVGGSGLCRAVAGALAINESIVGTGGCLLFPVSTATDTLTVTASSTAASLKLFANCAKLYVTRVA